MRESAQRKKPRVRTVSGARSAGGSRLISIEQDTPPRASNFAAQHAPQGLLIDVRPGEAEPHRLDGQALPQRAEPGKAGRPRHLSESVRRPTEYAQRNVDG